jgi:hypothetical protein
VDGIFEFLDREEGFAAQPLSGYFGEPALDLIEPRAAGKGDFGWRWRRWQRPFIAD